MKKWTFRIVNAALVLLLAVFVVLYVTDDAGQDSLQADDANNNEQNEPQPNDINRDTTQNANDANSDRQDEANATDPEVLLREYGDRIVEALDAQDFETIATYVHPQEGVRFSPYAYVDVDEHQVFSRQQVEAFMEDDTEYVWGTQDGKGGPIERTAAEYYEEYLYVRDFNESDDVSIDAYEQYGNIPPNAAEVYPEATFVEYYVPASEEGGMDWANLSLGFEEEDGDWSLVAIIVDRWTI